MITTSSQARFFPPSRLFLSCFILLIFAFTASAFAPAAEQRLTKLAPESVAVPLENGRGMANMIFVLAAGASVPNYRWTSAVGSVNAIPKEQIKFEWLSEPQTQTGGRSLLTGQLSVNTQGNVEPATNYAGRIIFYWPDAEQPVDFTVSDRTTLDFSIAPARLDLTLGQFQPGTAAVRIKNTGKSNIHKLIISSSDLLDSETQHRVELSKVIKDFSANPLSPAHEAEVQFEIPRPPLAGSYVGTLEVVAEDGRTRQSIPLVLRSRGPVPGRNGYIVPFILFGATLLLGYVLSTKLEQWFNLGGLQRAEALLSLQKSQHELTRLSRQVGQWGTGRPQQVFANTRVRLQLNLTELRELIARVSDLSREQLVSAAQRFANAEALGSIFESAVNVALRQWPNQEEKLNRVLTELDAVAPTSDPNTYRESLRAVLERAASEAEGGTSVRDARKALPELPSSIDLKSRIEFMARLQSVVVAIVVFIVAYQLFYAKDFSFGTLLDYLGVFLWSLGLTQAGSQILARARSTFTPS